MRCSVFGDGVWIGHKLYSYIDRRLEFALGRFGPAIRQVAVRVADINGPRGGVDKRCQITVALRDAGSDSITISYTADNLNAAIAGACERVKRAVGRLFERKRAKHAYHRRRMGELDFR